MSEQDKRYKERYDLELPVMVRWKDSGGCKREAPGTARNISPSGVFLVCVSPIGKGCAVNLDFNDPLDLGGCIPSRISATGTVLRGAAEAEHAEGYGHGIEFERFSFARIQDR